MESDLLPEPASSEPPKTPSWRVRASAFRDPVRDSERVADALRLPLEDAQRQVVEGMFPLDAGARRADADWVAEQLRALGAKAVVEDGRAPSTPPRPVASTEPPPPEPVESPEEPPLDARPSFWREAPWALVAPVLGRGAWLLLACGLLGAASFVVVSLPGLLSRLLLGATLGLAGVGALTEIFGRLAQAASGREDGEAPDVTFAPPPFTTLIFRGLFTSGLLALFAGLLFALARARFPALTLGLLTALAWAYWPMGLAVQGISGELTRILDVVAVVRGVVRAPLEYLAVVAASGLVWVGIGLAAGGALVSIVIGGIDTPLATGATLAFVGFVLIGYLHGVLGYLMGALIATKEEAFLFLRER